MSPGSVGVPTMVYVLPAGVVWQAHSQCRENLHYLCVPHAVYARPCERFQSIRDGCASTPAPRASLPFVPLHPLNSVQCTQKPT